jgi:hypothetical protein
MPPKSLEKLLHDIVYRVVPLAAAGALALSAAACECSNSKETVDRVVEVEAEAYAAYAQTANANGELPLESCETICGPLEDYSTLLSCHLNELEHPNADATGNAGDSPATSEDPNVASGTGVVCVEEQQYCEPAGRKPQHFSMAHRADSDCSVGDFFAKAAALEAASVYAFETLAADLRRLGAPAHFSTRAMACADDERRHTTDTARIAQQHGATPSSAQVACDAERSLFDIALENATEGCVRETWGALVAQWQAHASTDECIRTTMKTIAAEETGHAMFSWDLHRWLFNQLDSEQRQRIETAMQTTTEAIEDNLDRARSVELVTRAGLPSPQVARQLFEGLRTECLA